MSYQHDPLYTFDENQAAEEAFPGLSAAVSDWLRLFMALCAEQDDARRREIGAALDAAGKVAELP